MNNNNQGLFPMVAKTLFGFEEILAKELKQLGAQSVQTGVRNVSFVGDIGFMYKANLCLRTALRILKPIGKRSISSEQDVYKVMLDIPWEDYMTNDHTFAIRATVMMQKAQNSMYVAQKAKDGLVDRFRNRTGSRPSVDKDFPDLSIHLYVTDRFLEVSLDSSGASLHQRGYRTATNIAPINEVLAAGILLHSGWNGDTNFLDPMCGSGTLLIEAAMIACNIPPSLNRKEFAFQKWLDWNNALYTKIEESALKKVREFPHSIIGYDKAPSAIRKAQQNVQNANLSEFVTISQNDFFHTQKEQEEKPLHMVFNPPYGERLIIDVDAFYKRIGDTLKQSYAGTNAWFITSNLEAIKSVGLRPSRKIKLFNGKLESKLVKYELYSGTKKIHKLKTN
ncbi:MAG: Ribosomal RNA large subunit methyltransferase L [Bacteroidota bacterium]|nr:MAG: Ribosomal RNA large subunit methyltransferase L [Bacteroidota bacterium]